MTNLLEVLESEDSTRLDLFLKNRFKERSRAYFKRLIENGDVLLNSKKVKTNKQVKKGDKISITFKDESFFPKPQNIPLDIIYEDDDILCINKKENMVTHPAPGNLKDTLVNALLFHFNSLPGDPLRPGIVHRLDKGTSGLILVAKNKRSYEKLLETFSKREIEKIYLCICFGNPQKITIKKPIARDKIKKTSMAIRDDGKEAVSSFETLFKNGDFSLVKAEIKTGRTHQIRVHLKYLKSPILGDPTYGNRKINKKLETTRPLLHAFSLKFNHPITEKPLFLKAPLPSDFKKYFNSLFDTEKIILAQYFSIY